MQIVENIVLGFDLGIASIGWSLVDTASERILDAGVWTFNAPETDKEKTPKNQKRQETRSIRRTIKHRRQRMNDVRDLLFNADLFPNKDKQIAFEAAKEFKTTPWQLRADSLTRKLSPAEFGLCLYHIARHRGFQTNRKGGEANTEAGEDQKALKAMQGLGDKIAIYQTFGEALNTDSELSYRKRNISGDYGRTPKRDWLRNELKIIFEKQQNFGNPSANDQLLKDFIDTAFFQRPLQDSVNMVGNCPFEQNEKRSSKHAPSFEKFRFLQKLNHITLYMRGCEDWTLTKEQIAKLGNEFGKQGSYTYKTLRKDLDIDKNARFKGISPDDEGNDIATRKARSADGTRALRAALGEKFESVDIAQLDDAMFAIAFHETNESVANALSKIGLNAEIESLLNIAVANNIFKDVKTSAHISAKACRNIIPGLLAGVVYSEACKMAGYDHSAPDASPLMRLKKEVDGQKPSEIRKKLSALLGDPKQHLIASPTARKALIEAIKQFVAIVNNHVALKGQLPGKIHVEVARDVGKSADERRKIESGIEKRNKTLDNVAKEFEQTFGRAPGRGTQDLLIFELANEQGWKCMYSGEAINPQTLFDGQTYQIDHILPWSRFGDDSFANKTLCTARANQAKKHRTPVEWALSRENGAPDLDEYLARVESCKEMKGIKKRNYTLKNATEVEESFRTRNLNDTRWACRLFLQSLELFYPPNVMVNENGKQIRRLYARPGQLTAKARQSWGVERLKKEENGKRKEDDRHHAIDAIVVAAMSEGMLQALTRAHQQAEKIGSARAYEGFEPPWPMFRDDVIVGIEKILVARAEEKRVSGQKHMDTVRGFDKESGTVFERQTPEKLMDWVVKQGDEFKWHEILETRFERPERSRAIIDALAEWERDGRPNTGPLGPTGDKIGKIRVIAPSNKVAVPIRGGTADRGDMARVDVFSKANAKGKRQFFLVPIYPHQVAGDDVPPNRAVAASTPETEWPVMDETFDFEFSIFSKSWVEVVKPDGTVIEGYFRGVNRALGAINISPHLTQTLPNQITNIGARNLHAFCKYQVDRLGTKHLVEKEVRTWRGEEYISAKPPE